MNKKYFTGNVVYLPISHNDLGPAKMYIMASVDGDVFMNSIHTAESLEKRFKAGEIKSCEMIMPTDRVGKHGMDYKRVW